MKTATAQRMRQVSRRLRLAAAGRLAHRAFVVLAAAYAAAFLAQRLLGLFPDIFPPWGFFVVPAAALLFGLLFHRRPLPMETAHHIDEATQSGDVFLTALLADTAPVAFRPLVEERAEAASRECSPRQAAPLAVNGRCFLAWLTVLVLLAAGRLFLPQLDPFGREKARRELAGRREAVRRVRRALAARKALLHKKQRNAANSPEVVEATQALTDVFRAAVPTAPKQNLRKLADCQKQLEDLWREKNREILRRACNQANARQRFGVDGTRFAQWQKELEQGKTSALQNELRELRRLAEKLKQTADPEKRRRLEQELARRLKAVKNFTAHGLGNPAAANALEQALKQLALARNKALSREALEALGEAIELSEVEMKNLAAGLRDMKTLKKAMTAARMAKQVNQKGKLDGKGCTACQSLEDYVALYRKMLAASRGPGPGMRGAGTGQGGIAPENESTKTGRTARCSPSQLIAGKTIRQWKSKGAAPDGQAATHYAGTLNRTPQNLDEAIAREEVPPGYHDAIRRYFSTPGEKESKKEPPRK